MSGRRGPPHDGGELAATSWIHEPAAVTQSRALRSGKVHASFTLQKNAGSKYSSIAPISCTWPPKYLQV